MKKYNYFRGFLTNQYYLVISQRFFYFIKYQKGIIYGI